MKITAVSVPFAGVPEIQRNLVEGAVHLRKALDYAKEKRDVDSGYHALKAPFVQKTLAALKDPAFSTFMGDARNNLVPAVLVPEGQGNEHHTVQSALKSHGPAVFVRHVADVARQQAQQVLAFIGQNGEKLLEALLPPKKPQPASTAVPTTTEAVLVS